MGGIAVISFTRLSKRVKRKWLSSSFHANTPSNPHIPVPAIKPPHEIFFRSTDVNKSFRKIPGPLSIPIVGNFWKNYRGKNLENAPLIYGEYARKYGPLVKERVFFGRTLVHVFGPYDMKKIYDSDEYTYPTRYDKEALSVFRERRWRLSSYSNGGLLACNALKWKKLRTALGDNLLHEQSNEAFEQITNDLVAEIYRFQTVREDPSKREVILLPMLYRWALECMGAVTIGQRIGALEDDVDERIDHFIQCIHDSHEAVFNYHNSPKIFTRKWYKQLEKSHDGMFSFLKRRTNDVLYKYYKVAEQLPTDVDDGEPIRLHKCMAYNLTKTDLDERDIRTLVIDMFHEGIYATAHILAFALHYLSKNRKIQDSIQHNLIKKFNNPEDKFSSKLVDDEIRNVILETMRLNPPTIGTRRVLQEDLVLSGYNVPKGTTCILHHQVASLQSRYFHNPLEFNPHRFSQPSKAANVALNPQQSNKRSKASTENQLSEDSMVAFSPFSMGPRACPGREIAINQLTIGLTMILRHFKVSNMVQVGSKSGFISKPDTEMRMGFSTLD